MSRCLILDDRGWRAHELYYSSFLSVVCDVSKLATVWRATVKAEGLGSVPSRPLSSTFNQIHSNLLPSLFSPLSPVPFAPEATFMIGREAEQCRR